VSSTAEILIIVGLAYVYAVIFALIRGQHYLFKPPQTGYRDAGGLIRIPVAKGETLAAIHRINPAAGYTVLVLHGNSEDLADIVPLLEWLHGKGYSVLAFDYRGYGLSPGHPSEASLFGDALATYDHAVNRLHIPSDSILVWGRSLGSGPAIHLAASRPVGALVVEGGFRSAHRVPTRLRLLPFDRFDNARLIGRIDSPVVVLHGTGDRVVPSWHARALFRRARDPKRLLWVDGPHHVDLHLVDPKAVSEALEWCRKGSGKDGLELGGG
jgi:fermentation-respiration switch protein FrsA (DUF1100 family)